MEHEVFTITPEESLERVDKVIGKRFPDLSRTHIHYLIEEGFVTSGDKPIKKGGKQKPGTEIEIIFSLPPEITLEPENIPLDIIYEDDDIIAINKPAGLVVHPAVGNPSGTLVNALLYHCRVEDDSNSLRPGIVHRLDKETSGIILCAKTTTAHQKLIEQFMNREIQKEYIAITVGAPASLHIDAPIGRHKVHRKQMCVTDEGKPATTTLTILKKNERLAAVLAKPITGRTHQIRVHLQHVNAPVLGDKVYGSAKMNGEMKVNRQLLHAQKISFKHPVSGEEMSLEAEPPRDFLHIFTQF